MKKYKIIILLIVFHFLINGNTVLAQTAMISPADRKTESLNGQWNAIIDPTNTGEWRKFWEEKKPEKKTDFSEYSFEGSLVLNVPADFNSQLSELNYYEGIVWYKKTFTYPVKNGKRLFLHFGAVNYKADVYLNGKLLGSHEGGFTPFQFEITNLVNASENSVVVRVNSKRLKDGIPGEGYDWFNYGGITREVTIIETPMSFIEDYSIQLKKNSNNEVLGWVKVTGATGVQKIKVSIPELNLNYTTKTDVNGYAVVQFKSNFTLWSPENPTLYKIIISSESDSVTDQIGFRNIEVKGAKIVLNGKPIFIKAINFHEEMPLRGAKAYSEEDALLLLNWAKELGCNLVRLAHYPHSEHTVRLAEKMGVMVWEELPIYQHIEFSAVGVEQKMDLMLKEMIKRDKNRCGIIVWSLSNETYQFTENRDNALIKLSKQCKILDPTRLTTTVICTQGYTNNEFNVWDPLYNYFDVISINEYLGWYTPWQGLPKETKWKLVNSNKPVIISEFGGEALYGNTAEPKDAASSWNESYQEQIYKDQIEMFATVPNLAGVCPWILCDFRSLSRLHPVYQKGWNRKGLLSDKGEKKKAWYVLKAYYENENNNIENKK
ncbi:MAG: glycoside hydrolase family 2 [Flavobacterium sp.]|nr:glycoside hydrolase family 2 [Flavobacterium sp.]